MIVDYVEFALHVGEDEYLSNDDIKEFQQKYVDYSLPEWERIKKIEEWEDEFFKYFYWLNEDELICFFEDIKNRILNKDYMDLRTKAYKIFHVCFQMLCSLSIDNKWKYTKKKVLKKYFKNLYIEMLSIYKDWYLEEYQGYYSAYLESL